MCAGWGRWVDVAVDGERGLDGCSRRLLRRPCPAGYVCSCRCKGAFGRVPSPFSLTHTHNLEARPPSCRPASLGLQVTNVREASRWLSYTYLYTRMAQVGTLSQGPGAGPRWAPRLEAAPLALLSRAGRAQFFSAVHARWVLQHHSILAAPAEPVGVRHPLGGGVSRPCAGGAPPQADYRRGAGAGAQQDGALRRAVGQPLRNGWGGCPWEGRWGAVPWGCCPGRQPAGGGMLTAGLEVNN